MERESVQFSFILYRCAIAFRNELNKLFQKEFGEDLTTDSWYILTALWAEDNLSHNLLAERVSRDKASLSRTLDIMESKGLVKRTLAANDKRSSMIALTRKANDLHIRANEVAVSFTQNELKGLSAIEVKELMRMIDHVYSNIRFE